MRIVSICPSNTEILCALGFSDSLVGLDRSSDWPPEIRGLPRVGPDLEVDLERVAELRPDLVFSSLSVPGMEQNLARLDAAGIPQVVVDAQSLDQVYRSILLVGRVLGAAQRAHALIVDMRARLAAVEERAARLPRRPKVFLEWWPRPVIVPGRDCWTTEMIRLAGGESLFADLELRSTPVENHRVLERPPDLMLTCWCGVPHDKQRPEKMAERSGWDRLEAVQKKRMYAAEECYFGRPGPRVVDGVEWLHDKISLWAQEQS
ncbi:MAG TPA: cobalamin-binding protein [Myxococcota bacterium]|nr:cobalamin-binding protein [Myxococcota bacterium]HND30461.1 cobalamin-binding protein [Myxococcota bacterium]HNH46709.1 cobalamin-binding protein [Myxococcota bacterium]